MLPVLRRLAVSLLLVVTLTAAGMAQSPTVIRVVTGGTQPAEFDHFVQVAESYNALNPSVVIEFEEVGLNEINAKLATLIAGGVAPDIVFASPRYIVGHAATGAFVDLDDWLVETRLKDDIPPIALETLNLRGVQWAVPSSISHTALVYNSDFFLESGVPSPNEQYDAGAWDFDAFAEALRRIARFGPDGDPTRYGYAASMWDGDWISWIWRNGGSVVSEDRRRSTIHEPAAVEALEYLYGLINESRTARWGGRGEWLSGNSAMYMDGAWAVTSYTDMSWSWDYAPPPSNIDEHFVVGFPTSYSIVKDSNHIAEAFQFLSYLMSEEIQRQRIQVGRAPSRLSVFPESLDAPGLPPSKDRYGALITSTRFLPISPVWFETRDIIGAELQAASNQTIPVRAATEQITQRIDPLLASW